LPNGEKAEGQPTIGGYEPDQVPEGSLRPVNGLEFVFALTPDSKEYFDNKLLHFADGRGRFLREHQ